MIIIFVLRHLEIFDFFSFDIFSFDQKLLRCFFSDVFSLEFFYFDTFFSTFFFRYFFRVNGEFQFPTNSKLRWFLLWCCGTAVLRCSWSCGVAVCAVLRCCGVAVFVVLRCCGVCGVTVLRCLSYSRLKSNNLDGYINTCLLCWPGNYHRL